MVRLDVAEGRFEDAALAYERKGDIAQAAELYASQAGLPLRAAEALLRAARSAVLWGGKERDWQPAGSTQKAVREQLQQARELAAAAASAPDAAAAAARAAAEVEVLLVLPCDLEVLRQQAAAGSPAEVPTPALAGAAAAWQAWRGRLSAAPGTLLPQLCLLRRLTDIALARARSVAGASALPPQQQAQTQQPQQHGGKGRKKQGGGGGRAAGGGGASAGASSSVGAAAPQQQGRATAAAPPPELPAAAADLLSVWGSYQRQALDAIQVLRLSSSTAAAAPAALGARGARLLAALQSYHCVVPDAADPANTLELRCPRDAAWILLGVEQLGLAVSVPPGASKGSSSARGGSLRAADFAAGAARYWACQVLAPAARGVAEVLLALERQLLPSYPAFLEAQQQLRGSLAVVDPAARLQQQAGEAAAGAADSTQLRAQLLTAAAKGQRLLVQVRRGVVALVAVVVAWPVVACVM